MRNSLILAAALAALIQGSGPGAAAPEAGLSQISPDAVIQPRMPPRGAQGGPTGTSDGGQTLPPGEPVFGSNGAVVQSPAVGRGTGAEPARPEAAPKPPTRGEMLDRLLGRLAKASDAGEAQGIASLVQQIWMHSGSDTADLLMARAVTAMNGNRHDVAEALLDQILALQPDWAEAWNKRATLRFLDNDDSGSMEDIGHVLTLEPRHFGALSGMAFILERHGEGKAALTAMRKVLELYPENTDIRKAVDKLTPAVEGQGL
jgi:tetratricopeptide (TPR) repeat protein